MSLPLTGIRTLSLSRLLPGAYCTRLLADLGADVIKLEQPGTGDPLRLRPGFFKDLDHDKMSLTCDLKSVAGREICHRLVKQSDVFIEGFRPGVASRLKVDYVTLKSINPRLIYVSITGFGQDGPYRNIPSHDLMNQAVAGSLADKITRDPDNFTQPLLPAGDFSSAMFAAISILAALLELKTTGEGRYLDISMTDGLVAWMGIYLTPPSDLAGPPPLAGSGLFRTGDGRFLVLGVDHEQHLWRNLCLAVGRDDLGELTMDNRTTRYAELTAILKEAFLSRGRDEWLPILHQADVPAAPAYQSAAEVAGDPQLLFRRMIIPAFGGEKGNIRVGSPLPFEEAKNQPMRPAPELGQNNADILQSLGYSASDIEKMKKSGVI